MGRLAIVSLKSTLIAAVAVLSLTACAPAAVVKPVVKKPEITPQVVAVIGDFGSGDKNEAAVAKMVSAAKPDFIASVGDNVYKHESYYKLVRKYYPEILVPVAGNHDHLNDISRFDKYFNVASDARTYSYLAPSGIEFFVLDSTAGLDSIEVARAQKIWLKEATAKSTALYKVVLLHHPPYSSGKHGNTKRYQWDFASMGVQLVISGHDHHYERIMRKGVTYLIDGTGGARLYKCLKRMNGSRGCRDTTFGAVFLMPTETEMKTEFRNTKGKVLDSFVVKRAEVIK